MTSQSTIEKIRRLGFTYPQGDKVDLYLPPWGKSIDLPDFPVFTSKCEDCELPRTYLGLRESDDLLVCDSCIEEIEEEYSHNKINWVRRIDGGV